jgi:hypothetical protein
MHPVLREAEHQFRRTQYFYISENIPELADVSIRDNQAREEMEFRIGLSDGTRLIWGVPSLQAYSVPPPLRSRPRLCRELHEMWDRMRTERRARPPLMAPAPEEMRIDLRPGWVNYAREIPPPEVPANDIFALMARARDRMMRDTMLYGISAADPAMQARPRDNMTAQEVAQRQQERWARGEARLAGCSCSSCRPGERERRARDEYQRKREEADARSIALMSGWLSPDQLAEWQKSRCFHVIGSDSGNRYRILCYTAYNIIPFDKDGKAMPRICFGPWCISAVGDVMLAQKIALETDEAAALKVANVEQVRPPLAELLGR